MDFQDRFARVFCSLFSVFQVTTSHLSDLLSEDVNMPEVIRITGINPVSKFRFGPFESVDDSFYKPTYVKSTGNEKRTMEIGDGKQVERLEAGNREISNRKIHNEKEEFEEENWDQVKWLPNDYSQIPDVQQRIKLLQNLISNVNSEVSNIEKSVPLDYNLKKMATDDKIENKMKISKTSGLKNMNNIIYNNRYIIGNIFIINRLPEGNSSLKETDVEILKELTAHKMKELLEKTVNNLTEDGIPGVTQFPPQYEYQIDLLKQLQRNFSKIFNRQNMTLEHVNQMSKIIDFVERFHGTIGGIRSKVSGEEAKKRTVKSLGEVLYEDVNGEEGVGEIGRKASERHMEKNGGDELKKC